MTISTTDRAARLAEFRRLFAALPGPRKADRIRQACAMADVKEITVRQWAMATPPRVPSHHIIELWKARTVKSAA